MPSRSMKIHNSLNKSAAIEASENSDDDGDKNVTQSNPLKKTTSPQHVLSDISRESQERTQHCHIPSLTLGRHFITPYSELRSYPTCKFLAPQPIYVSDAPSQLLDVGLKRPLAWDNWHKRLMRIKTNYDKSQNVRGISALEKENIYDRNFFELAEHLDLNPDPFFDGTYDYYYSGGNLALLPTVTSLMPTPLVAHFAAEKRFTFRISKLLESMSSGPHLYDIYKEEHETNSNEIFEVRALKSYQVNRGNMFATRQRDKITLQQLFLGEPDDDTDSDVSENDSGITANGKKSDELEPGEIKVVNLSEFRSSKVPMMSFAQLASDPSKFVLSNANQTVRVYNIGTDAAVLDRSVRLATDKTLYCNFLRAWQGQVVFFANSSYICPIDLRTKPDQWTPRLMHSDSKDYILCDTITGLSTSNNLNQLYVATSHKLHCLDVRYMSSDGLEGKGSLVTLTHQLKQAPLFIDKYAHDDVEFVALASAQAGDLCICEVSAAKHLEFAKFVPNAANYAAYTLPYQPPTLTEALQSARLSGKCLSPRSNIKERIQKSTTGLAFYDMNDYRGKRSKQQQAAAYLMTANSIGDVYAQTVKPRGSQDEPDPRTDRHTDDIMVKYEQEVRNKAETQLQCTSVHNLREMREIFATKRYSLPKNSEPISGNALKRCQGWRKRVSTLRRHQDYLAEYMLSIWDVEDENEYVVRPNFEKHIESEDKKKFIDDWVGKQLPLATTLEQTITIDAEATLTSIKQQAHSSDELQVAGEDQRSDVSFKPVFASSQEIIDEDQKVNLAEMSPFARYPNDTFDTSLNIMVSLPMDISQTYLQGNNETLNFSQRLHSTAVKKRASRKGF